MAAAACPRAVPATLLAPLSHILMNGFFLSQGFFIRCRSVGVLKRVHSPRADTCRTPAGSRPARRPKREAREGSLLGAVPQFLARLGEQTYRHSAPVPTAGDSAGPTLTFADMPSGLRN